jgi:hypothetical protein
MRPSSRRMAQVAEPPGAASIVHTARICPSSFPVLISLISRLPCEREIFKTAYADATRTHLLVGDAKAKATAGYQVSDCLLPSRNKSTSRYKSLPRKIDSLDPDLMSYIKSSSVPKAARWPKSESAASATRSRGAFYQYSFMSGVSPRHSRLDL